MLTISEINVVEKQQKLLLLMSEADKVGNGVCCFLIVLGEY